MNELMQATNRRTLLQRGVILVAGALGLQVTPKEARGDPAPKPTVPPAGGSTLRFYARRLRVQAHGQAPGQLPASNGRRESQGELLGEPEGEVVGRFFATGFHPEAFSHCSRQTDQVELQTFQVPGGSLFGIGPGRQGAGTEVAHALLGGTGRYAGARGSYLIREARVGQGETRIEFVVNLIS